METGADLVLRAARLPEDSAALLALPTGFRTDRVIRVEAGAGSFQLTEEPADPPLAKSFDLAGDLGEDRAWDRGIVAEIGGQLVGFAAVRLERWNRRAALWHLYVAEGRRGAGVGRALIRAAEREAAAEGMRAMWLEVTSVNVPAIRFYRRAGYTLCGLDLTLYDPAEVPGEVALFFARDLA